MDELRTLHAEAVAEGDFGIARRCRLLIGCSASDAGENEVAVRELARLVDDGHVAPGAEPEVYLCLGRSLAALGRADESVALFESCLDELRDEPAENAVVFVRFSTYLSYALADAGELRRAKNVLSSALPVADGVDDTMTRVRFYYSRARLAWAASDWEQGRTFAQRAIALLEATDDTPDLLRMHLLVADIGLLVGDVDAAADALGDAKRLVGSDADTQDLGACRRVEAFVAARRGDGDAATRLAGEAIEALAQDAPARGRAYWALAEGLVALGEHEEALQAYPRGVRADVDREAVHPAAPALLGVDAQGSRPARRGGGDRARGARSGRARSRRPVVLPVVNLHRRGPSRNGAPRTILRAEHKCRRPARAGRAPKEEPCSSHETTKARRPPRSSSATPATRSRSVCGGSGRSAASPSASWRPAAA